MIEAYFIHLGGALGGEDGCWTEFGRPEEKGVERSHEELEGAYGEGGGDFVEVLFVEDCCILVV